MANQIKFNIGYTIDKNGLNELKSALKEIQNLASSTDIDSWPQGLEESVKAAEQLEVALDRAWNGKLNQLDLTKFNNEIKSSFGSITDMRKQLESVGSIGTNAYNKMASSVLGTNLQLRESSKILDDMATTMGNTIKWGIASSMMNNLTGSIQQAYGFTKSLDRSLNDIRIVTEKSAEDMADFAVQANKAAQGLAASTTDYTNASLIYYQQGLSDEEVQARTETTLKTANVTQQTAAEVSELLTAVWNGYKVSADEAEEYVDKLAAVAATTASDLEELSTGMSRVASAAAAMGVDVDQLNAQLATIVSVTRQAPESVGTALRSIYARMGQLKADGEDEFGVTLGNYTKQMQQMGIEILDQQGNMREMGDVIEEVAVKWNGWTQAQKNAAAQAMAGTRQYNNLVALFDNWDMYTEALETSQNALGTLQKQQDIYLDSTQAKLQQLDTKLEETYQLLINSDMVNNFASGIGNAVDRLNDLMQSLDSGFGIFSNFGLTIANVFNKQIAGAISKQIQNIQSFIQNADQARVKNELIADYKTSGRNVADSSALALEVKYAEQLAGLRKTLSSEEYNELTNQQRKIGLLEEEIDKKAKELGIEVEDAEAQNDINRYLEIRQGLIQDQKREQEITVSYYKDSAQILKDILADEELLVDLGENRKEIASSLRLIQSNLDSGSENELLVKEVINQLENKNVLSKKQLEIVLKAITEEYKKQKALAGDLNELSEEELATAQLREDEENRIAQTTSKQNIATITKGLTSLAIAGSTVSSIVNTIGDDTLTAGEKADRVLSNILFTLPMLISSLDSIKGFLPALAAELKLVENSSVGLRTSFFALIKAFVTNPFAWAVAGVAGLTAASIHATNEIEKNTKAVIDNAKESRDAAITYQEEAKSVRSIYDEYQNLYQNYQETGEGKEELKSKTEQLCEAYGIEINQLDLLSDSYDKVNQKIAEAREQKAQEAVENARSGLRDAETAMLQQGFNEDYYTEDVYKDPFNPEKYREQVISFNDSNLGGDESKFWETITKSLKDKLSDLIESSNVAISGNEWEPLIIKGVQSADEFIQIYKAMDDAMSDIANGMTDLTDADLNASETYQAAREWLSTNRENYEKYLQLQDQVTEAAKEMAAARIENSSGINLEDIDSLGDFEEYRKKYIEALEQVYKENGWEVDKEKFEEMANEYMSTLDSVTEYLNEYNIEEALRKNLTDSQDDIEKFIKELKDSDELDLVATLSIDEGASIEEIRKVVEVASDAAAASINTEGLSAVADAISSISENGDLSGLDEETNKLFEDFLNTTEGINGAASAMEEWNVVSEEGLVAQIEYLQDLQEAHYGTAEEAVEATRAQTEAELEYLEVKKERLDAEQEEMDDLEKRVIAYEQLKDVMGENFDENSAQAQAYFESAEAAEEAKQKVAEYTDELNNTNVALEETRNTLYDTDWDLEITMTGVDEILQVGESIVTEAERIKEATALIGEGFLVSAENADQLAAVYPALLQDAQVLADGQIQLSQASVDSYLGDQSILLEGDKTTAIARIDNEIEVLTSKKSAAEAELELAKTLAEANVTLSKEQIQKIADGRTALTKHLIDLGVKESDANEAVAAAMAGNMDEYSRIVGENGDRDALNMAKVFAAMASASSRNIGDMIDNLYALQQQFNEVHRAAKGEETNNKYSANGTGDSSVNLNTDHSTGNFKGADRTNIDPFVENMKDWTSDLELDISSYEQAIADLTALKSKLLANTTDAQEVLNNARNGLGGYTNKELEDMNKPSSSKSSIPKSSSSKKPSISSKKSSTSKKKKEKEEKTEDPDVMEYLEEEADRYHDIDIRIEEVERSLDHLQDKQKKLFGKDLIKNLGEQLNILEKQKEVYEEKIKLAKKEAEELSTSLKAQGVIFNDDGSIANYKKALDAKLAYVNAVIARYNEMTAEEQKNFKEVVDAAKQEYENFKDQIERYDELTFDTIPDLQDKVQEALDEQIEIEIEKFNMEIEIRLDMADAEKDYLDFRRKVIDQIKDDEILKNAKADLQEFQSYFDTNGTGIGPIQALTKHVEDVVSHIKEINDSGTSPVYGDNKAQAMEDLKEYYSELMEQLEDMEDLADEIRESYLDMIDEAIEKFDEQVDQYEYINDLINHDMNIIGLLYGDDAYDQMTKYYNKIEENNNQELDFLRKRVDYAYQMMQAEENPEAREKWEKEWEDSLSKLNKKVEDSINDLISKYKNVINQTFNELNNKVTNGLGLDYIGEEWELINENADEYLDTINSMYAIQDLENKYLDAISAEDSLEGQQKLNDLMNEQLGMLREKDKLTQYDVDRANMLFEIALKQIALQNAQQNKSKMRLRRDSQGNYNYQFVSDEDSIADAQKELAEAQKELYNFDKDRYKQNLSDILDTYTEFQDKLFDLYNDETLTVEEREQKKALLVEQYNERINGLVEQNNDVRNNLYESAFQNLADMYNVDLSNFTDLTQEEQDLIMNSLIPQWDSGVQHMTDTFAGDEGFIYTCKDAFAELQEATQNYQSSLDELETAAGIDFDSIAEGYDLDIQRARELLEANGELIDQYSQEISAIAEVITELDSLIQKYNEARQAAIDATNAAYKLWQQEQNNAAIAAENNGPSGYVTGIDNSIPVVNGNSGGGSDTSNSDKNKKDTKKKTKTKKKDTKTETKKKTTGTGDGVPRVGDVVTYTGGLYYYDSYGSSPTGSRGPGKKVTITYLNPGAPFPIHVESNDSAFGWLKQSQIKGYDTGGYTGSWGNEGRLGILHEKELVLNSSDTENILSAVEVIRSMDSLVNGLNQSMINRLAGMSINMANANVPIERGNNKVDQNVHIQAEFPNVHDSREIENALNNLVNIASQHAFNNKR